MTPTVSVVIPVRDGAKYLAEALESVLTQSYQAAEVIAVDDGSQDRTPEVLAEHGRWVRVIRQGPLGLGTALNRGIASSKAELLAFCDSDDVWTPLKLERQVTHLRRHPGHAGVGGLIQQFVTPDVPQLTGKVRIDVRPVAAALLGTLLLRRTAADRVGPFEETAATATTVDWVGRLRHLGLQIDALEEVVLLRRIHGGNMTMKSADQTRARLLSALRAQLGRNRAAPRP